MNRRPLHSLRLQELRLEARLGCSAAERAIPQEIRVSVELRYPEAPHGATSDDLGDTICYARICEAFRAHVRGREYRLVEKLAADFHEILRTLVADRAEIALCLHKVRPPVDGLLGGVEYRVGDFS